MSRPIMYLDLETADADRIWDYGPGFIRLVGYALDDGPVQTTTDVDAIVRLIETTDCVVVGHNVLAFDLAALHRYHGLSVGRLVAQHRVVDTLLVARQVDPPMSGKADARRYNLDAVACRLLGDGKLGRREGSELKKLAAEFGGYDSIPMDDPRYVAYLTQDVELLRRLAPLLVVDDYLWREHEVMWRLGHISEAGFRVDVNLARRLVAGREARVEAGKQALHERYGLPLTGARPHATTVGKAALERAFTDCGVEPPRTPKGGLATGKDVLVELIEHHPDNTNLIELCGLVLALNGERTVPQTILDNTTADGRVHPDIDAGQATGRISVTKPGLTVMGKRDRANLLERALLLPDDGDVLVCVDLAQIDARAMAAVSQDPAYIAAFERGKDLHDEMAAAVFGEDSWDRSAGHHPRRGEAKAITHATSYGMQARALSDSVGCTVGDAHAHLARLAHQFPLLERFKVFAREEARRQILTSPFGRRMRVAPGSEFTMAPALMGQGTARDLLMQGVLRLPEWLLPCLRAVVHDELVLSVPADRAEEATGAVLKALQYSFTVPNGELPVLVLAEASQPGRDWADCYRADKRHWPEVARVHREQIACVDPDCTWHRNSAAQQPKLKEIAA